jgi:hypothetical protein
MILVEQGRSGCVWSRRVISFRTGPEPSSFRAGPQSTGEPRTTAGMSGHRTSVGTAGRGTYSLLTSGGGGRRSGVRVSPPVLARVCGPSPPGRAARRPPSPAEAGSARLPAGSSAVAARLLPDDLAPADDAKGPGPRTTAKLG